MGWTCTCETCNAHSCTCDISCYSFGGCKYDSECHTCYNVCYLDTCTTCDNAKYGTMTVEDSGTSQDSQTFTFAFIDILLFSDGEVSEITKVLNDTITGTDLRDLILNLLDSFTASESQTWYVTKAVDEILKYSDGTEQPVTGDDIIKALETLYVFITSTQEHGIWESVKEKSINLLTWDPNTWPFSEIERVAGDWSKKGKISAGWSKVSATADQWAKRDALSGKGLFIDEFFIIGFFYGDIDWAVI